MSTLLRDLGDLAAHYAPFAWFPLVWAVSLAAVCATGVVLRSTGAWQPTAESSPAAPARWTPAAVATGAALALFLCGYVTLVFYHDDLVGQDFNLTIGSRFANVLIWPWAGRFVPLASQEYSLLSLVGTSAALYHAWSMFQLAVLLACVYQLMDSTPAWLRFLAMLFLLAQASLVFSFFGLVFTERDLVFWLVVWTACMQSYARTGSRAAFVGAMVAAQFALYYKETAFVLIGGFAGSRLVLDAWRGWDLLKQRQYARFIRDHAMEFGNLALCAVFLLTYLIAISPHVTESYAASGGRQGAVMEVLATYVRSNLLAVTLAAAFLWRLVALGRAKQALDAFWEPLAAAGLLFALAYAALGITREYYLAPVDVIAVLYLGRLGYDALRGGPRLAMVAVVLLLGLILQRTVPDAAFYVLTRKEYVHGRVSLESALREHARAGNRSEVTLFFPQVGGFHLMEFAAFLRLKGWRPAHEPAAESSAPAFVIKSAHRYAEDRCYHSQEFRCVYAPSPQAGDLVVLLPGRYVTPAEIDTLRARSREVFHFRPQPTFVVRALRALVPEERVADLPADGYVFEY